MRVILIIPRLFVNKPFVSIFILNSNGALAKIRVNSYLFIALVSMFKTGFRYPY